MKNSNYFKYRREPFVITINDTLSKELAGYRLIDDKFVGITDEQEIKMLDEALKDDRFEGVNKHL